MTQSKLEHSIFFGIAALIMTTVLICCNMKGSDIPWMAVILPLVMYLAYIATQSIMKINKHYKR